MNKSKNKGRLFWITGISGAGKTTLGKKIKNKIELLRPNFTDKW